MSQGYTDGYSSTLGSGYTSGATSLIVASASGLPASGLVFFVLVAAEGANTTEVFKCTSYTGTTLTVVVAQANTSPSNHASGAAITGCYITAGALDGIRSDQSQIGTYASLSSVTGMKKGDRYRCSDSAYEFVYDGSAWQPFIGGQKQLTLPLASGSWTADANNPGSAIQFNTTFGYLYVDTNASTGTGAVQTKVIWLSAPATPYGFEFFVDYDISGGSSGTGEIGMILGFRQSSTGKMVQLIVGYGFSGAALYGGNNMTTAASFSSNPFGTHGGASTTQIVVKAPGWFKIRDDATNLLFYHSLDGQTWIQDFSVARGAFMTGGADEVCVGGYVFGGSPRLKILHMLQTG